MSGCRVKLILQYVLNHCRSSIFSIWVLVMRFQLSKRRNIAITSEDLEEELSPVQENNISSSAYGVCAILIALF